MHAFRRLPAAQQFPQTQRVMPRQSDARRMTSADVHSFSARSFLLFLVLSCLLRISSAQEVTGNLRGRLVDSLGHAVPNANVSITGPHLQGIRGSASDEDGYFILFGIPPGQVAVRVTHAAYRPVSVEHITIELGKTASLGRLVLHPQTHELREVVVSRSAARIDPATTTYTPNLRAEQFENLPVDRNYRSMTSLLPQANLSYYGDEVNVGGATGFENKYFVDGVEVTDPLIGASGTNLPYNFIQEIEVKAGGYGVGARSALGGLVNVITYSGSNEFHGSAFGFYTSNKFSENMRLGTLDVTQGDFSNYDVGFGLGGPIVLDRLWFYAAYNPMFNRRDVDVPSFGTYVDKTRTHSFAAKLNWRASDNLQLTFTTTGDPTQRDAVGRNINVPPSALANPDPYLQNIVEGGVNSSLQGTYTIGKNISLHGSIARVDRHDTGEGSTEDGRNEVHYRDFINDVWSGGVSSSWDSFRHGTVGKLSGTILLDGHSLNTGIEYKTNSVNNIYDYRTVSRFDTALYGESIGKGFGEVWNRIPSVFLHDSWRVFERLTVTAGIRWDGHSIVGSNGEVAQRISVPLQPRIGFVLLLDENNRQRIFGSFGRFSQEFALFQSANYHSGNGYDYFIRYNHDPRMNGAGGDTLFNSQHVIRPEVKDLQAQYFDEFSVGYERLIGWKIKAGLQGVYRTLRQAIDDAWLPDERRYQFGNPGRGILADWPKARREYSALTFTVERSGDEHFNFLASYVLSRDYGNYAGVFDAVSHGEFPNSNVMFNDLAGAQVNATGVLPNDRTHVFKFSGSYRFSFGLTGGIAFVAQTGTPLSEYAGTPVGARFLSPRGSAGRTPTIWDLNARLKYDLGILSDWQTTVILDIFHIASQRRPVDFNPLRYFGTDENGNLVNPNPTYGQAYRYQPSMSMRLGMEVSF